MYHYVRPTSATLPLHVMTPGTFQEHVRQLGAHYELATLESAMAKCLRAADGGTI